MYLCCYLLKLVDLKSYSMKLKGFLKQHISCQKRDDPSYIMDSEGDSSAD